MLCLCCGINFLSFLSLFLEGFLVILSARILTYKVLVNIVDLKQIIRQPKIQQTQLSVQFNLVQWMTFMNMPPLLQFPAFVQHL